MSIHPISSPQADVPLPVIALFPQKLPPPESPAPEASAAGGARQLSRWEDLEETWLAEERDFSHSGINE